MEWVLSLGLYPDLRSHCAHFTCSLSFLRNFARRQLDYTKFSLGAKDRIKWLLKTNERTNE